MEIGFLVILSTEESQVLGQNKHFTSTAASKIQQCDQNITLHKHISMDQNGAWILNRVSVTTKVTCKSLQLSALVVEYPGSSEMNFQTVFFAWHKTTLKTKLSSCKCYSTLLAEKGKLNQLQ